MDGLTQLDLKWDVRQRLILLETTLLMVGWVRVQAIIDTFGISRAQASKDFQLYRLARPQNLVYNKSAKYYEVSADFVPLLLTGKTSELLSVFHAPHTPNPPVLSLSAYQPRAAAINPLDRDIDLTVFRFVSCAAFNSKKIKVLYQSLNRVEPLELVLSPHTLVFTGYRWHVRAYSEHHHQYRDFLLARIKGQPEVLDMDGETDANDVAWHSQVPILIVPHPGLPSSHQRVIAEDYGMANNQIEVVIRGALVNYFLKLMYLEPDREHSSPKVQQIVVANKDEIQPWIWGD